MSTALLIAPCKFYAMDAQATTPPECLLLTAKAAGLLTLGTVESVLGVLTGIGGGILTHMTADHDKLLYAIGITGSFATVVFSLYHGIPTLYEGGSLLGQALTVDCR